MPVPKAGTVLLKSAELQDFTSCGSRSSSELALPLPEGSRASRLPELQSWAGCRQGMMLDLLGFG